MGKRKITKFEEIQNKVSKYVTFCKRKKGVIKKAMELSLLCGQEVMLTIYDKKKHKLVHYQSTQEFNPTEVNRLLSTPETKSRLYEEHTNNDFSCIGDQKPQTFNLRLDNGTTAGKGRRRHGFGQDMLEAEEEDFLDLKSKLKFQKTDKHDDEASLKSDKDFDLGLKDVQKSSVQNQLNQKVPGFSLNQENVSLKVGSYQPVFSNPQESTLARLIKEMQEANTKPKNQSLTEIKPADQMDNVSNLKKLNTHQIDGVSKNELHKETKNANEVLKFAPQSRDLSQYENYQSALQTQSLGQNNQFGVSDVSDKKPPFTQQFAQAPLAANALGTCLNALAQNENLKVLQVFANYTQNQRMISCLQDQIKKYFSEAQQSLQAQQSQPQMLQQPNQSLIPAQLMSNMAQIGNNQPNYNQNQPMPIMQNNQNIMGANTIPAIPQIQPANPEALQNQSLRTSMPQIGSQDDGILTPLINSQRLAPPTTECNQIMPLTNSLMTLPAASQQFQAPYLSLFNGENNQR